MKDKNAKDNTSQKQNINNPKNEFTFEQRKTSIEKIQVNNYGLLSKHEDNSPVNNRPINISVTEQTPDQVRRPRPVNNDSVYVNTGNRPEARTDNNSVLSNNGSGSQYRTDYIQQNQPSPSYGTRSSSNPYLNEYGMINRQGVQPQQPATPNNGSVVNTRAINLRPQQPAESASETDHREAMEHDARTPYTPSAEGGSMGIPYLFAAGAISQPVRTHASTPDSSAIPRRPTPVNIGSSPVSIGVRPQSPIVNPAIQPSGVSSNTGITSPHRYGRPVAGSQPLNAPVSAGQRLQSASPYLNEHGMFHKTSQPQVVTPNNNAVFQNRQSRISVNGHQPQSVSPVARQSMSPYLNERGMVVKQPTTSASMPNNNTVVNGRPSKIVSGQQVSSSHINPASPSQPQFRQSTSPYLNEHGMVTKQPKNVNVQNNQVVVNRPSKIVSGQAGRQPVSSGIQNVSSRIQANGKIQPSANQVLNDKGLIQKPSVAGRATPVSGGADIKNVNAKNIRIVDKNQIQPSSAIRPGDGAKVSSRVQVINQNQNTIKLQNAGGNKNQLSVASAQNALRKNGINVNNLSKAELKHAIETGKLGNRTLSASDIQHLKTVQVSKTNQTIGIQKNVPANVRLLKSADAPMQAGLKKPAGNLPAAQAGKIRGVNAGASKLVTDTNLKVSKTGTIQGSNVPKPVIKNQLDATKKLSVNKETIKPELLQKINTKEKNILSKNIKQTNVTGIKSKASTQHLNAQAKVSVLDKKTISTKRSTQKTIGKNNFATRHFNTNSIFTKKLNGKKIGFFGKRTPTEIVSGGVSVLMGVTMGVGALGPLATATSNQPYIAYYNLKGENLTGEDSEDISLLSNEDAFEAEEFTDWQLLLEAVQKDSYNTKYSGKTAKDEDKTVSQWLIDDMYDLIENDITTLENVKNEDIEELIQKNATLDGFDVTDYNIVGDNFTQFTTHFVYVGIPENPNNAPINTPETASSVSPNQSMPQILSSSARGNSYRYVEKRGADMIPISFHGLSGSVYRIYYADSDGNQFLGVNSSSTMYFRHPTGKYLAGWSLTEGATRPDFITYQKLDAVDLAKLKAASLDNDGHVKLYAVYLDNKTAVKLDTLKVISENEISPKYAHGDDYTTDEELSGYFTDKERSVQYHFTDGFGGDAYFSEGDENFGYAYNLNALFKTLLCMVVLASENSDALTNPSDAKKVSESLHGYCEEILKQAIEPDEGRTYSIKLESRLLPGTNKNPEYCEKWTTGTIFNSTTYRADTARMLAVATVDVDISIETLTTKDEEGNGGNGIYAKYFRDDDKKFKNDSQHRDYTFEGWTEENQQYCITYTQYEDDDFKTMFNIVFPPVSEYAYMSGDDNAAKIFNHLISQGYSVAAALAILGNLRVECPDPNSPEGDIDDHYEVTRSDGIKYVSLAKVPIDEFNDYFASAGKQWGDASLTIEDQVNFYKMTLGSQWLPKVTTANFFDQIGAWLGIDASKEKTEESKKAEACIKGYIDYYGNIKKKDGTPLEVGMKNRDYKDDFFSIEEDFQYAAKDKNKVVEEYLWITYPTFQSLSDIERATRALCVSFYALYGKDGISTLVVTAAKSEIRVKYAVEYSERVEYGTHGGGVAAVALQWALKTAADDTHGYGNQIFSSTTNNSGNPDYDCSSFVSAAYRYAYEKVLGEGFTGFVANNNLAAIDAFLTGAGFKKVNINGIATDSDLRPGDVLINASGGHTEMYVGPGQQVGAHTDKDGWQVGDQSADGGEISVVGLGSWPIVYRCPLGGSAGATGTGIEEYEHYRQKAVDLLYSTHVPTDAEIASAAAKVGMTVSEFKDAVEWAACENGHLMNPNYVCNGDMELAASITYLNISGAINCLNYDSGCNHNRIQHMARHEGMSLSQYQTAFSAGISLYYSQYYNTYMRFAVAVADDLAPVYGWPPYADQVWGAGYIGGTFYYSHPFYMPPFNPLGTNDGFVTFRSGPNPNDPILNPYDVVAMRQAGTYMLP